MDLARDHRVRDLGSVAVKLRPELRFTPQCRVDKRATSLKTPSAHGSFTSGSPNTP